MEQVTGRWNMTDEEMFQSNLGSYVIVDIGTLETYNTTPSGIFGVIRGNRLVGKKVVKYGNVELLQMGNAKGGLRVSPAGEDLYLLFCTRTTLKSTITRVVDNVGSKIYSINGMKGIPVTSALNWSNSVGFDREGNFIITTPGTYLKFSVDDSIRYQQQDILSFIKNKDGSMSLKLLVERFIFYFNPDGTWIRIIQKDGIIKEWRSYEADDSFVIRRYANSAMSDDDKKDMSSFDDYLLETKYSSDGTISITRKDSGGEVLWTETYNPDGSYSKELLDVYAESLDTEGILDVSSEGYALNTNGGKVTIANAQQSLASVLVTLIDNLVAAQMVGSPALHTFDPGTITNLNTSKSNLQQLLE